METNNVFSIFGELNEPRRESGNFHYPLQELIFLVISAVVSGADGWSKVVVFGNSRLHWLRKYFSFKNGICSEDTLERVFSALNPEQFRECFIKWTSNVAKLTEGEVIAIDGKTMRGSKEGQGSGSAVHIVSAFASANNLCIGQLATDKKSNEITAIPKLLELICIKGCTVTIDAMGCQKEIASAIRGEEADYILAVKDNQKELNEQVQKVFEIGEIKDVNTTTDIVGGRIETRTCSTIDDLRFLDDKEDWLDLKTIIRIQSHREFKKDGKTTDETRYYISSSSSSAAELNQAIREHWGVENKLHWVLDVAFNEDYLRARKGYSSENFAIVNKVALTMLTNDKSLKKGMPTKRLNAAWDDKYREKILKI